MENEYKIPECNIKMNLEKIKDRKMTDDYNKMIECDLYRPRWPKLMRGKAHGSII